MICICGVRQLMRYRASSAGKAVEFRRNLIQLAQ